MGVSGLIDAGMGGWCLLGNLGVSGPFGEGYVVSQDVGKGCVSVLALEWGGAVQHLVDEDAEGPPIDGTGVAASFDNFWGYVLFSPDERVGTEIRYAGFRIDGR